MLRRGTREIRPARNPDGTKRAIPTRLNNTQLEDSNEADTSDYEPTASQQSSGDLIEGTGSQTQSRQFDFESELDFLDACQRAMLMGNSNSNDIHTTPSPPPIFRDMGSYMSEFETQPAPATTQTISTIPPSYLVSTNTVTTQPMFVSESLPMPQAEVSEDSIDDDVQPEQSFGTIYELLDHEFGPQKEMFSSLSHSLAHSGHHAILGARLLNQVAQRFSLGANNLTYSNGVALSLEDVAEWMGQRIRTIQNWQTRENRRLKLLDLLAQFSSESRRPRHDTIKRILESLEGATADYGVRKLVDLDKYLARIEGQASAGL